MDIATEIRVMLARENKNISWLANELHTSQQNLSNKMRRNNFCTKDMEEIAEALGYEITIESIKK